MYALTWLPPDNQPHVTVTLDSLTPDGFLDAVAEADIPTDVFSDLRLYRALYAVCFQLLLRGDAEVCLDAEGTILVVPRGV